MSSRLDDDDARWTRRRSFAFDVQAPGFYDVNKRRCCDLVCLDWKISLERTCSVLEEMMLRASDEEV